MRHPVYFAVKARREGLFILFGRSRENGCGFGLDLWQIFHRTTESVFFIEASFKKYIHSSEIRGLFLMKWPSEICHIFGILRTSKYVFFFILSNFEFVTLHIVLICFKNGQVYFPFKKWVLSIQAITQTIFMGF